MRILHIIKGLGRGGAEMLLLENMKLHDRGAYQFSVIYYLPHKHHLVRELEELGVEVLCMNRRGNLGIVLSLFSTLRQARRINPNVIHAHLPLTGFVARLVGRILRVPVVYTEHNDVTNYHPLTTLLNRLTYALNRVVIAVSDESRKAIERQMNFRGQLNTVINGVRTDYFKRKSLSRTERQMLLGPNSLDKIVVGTVAVFRKQKQLDKWLLLAAKVLKRSDDFYFVVIGDGVEREKLEKLTDALGIREHVLFTGLVENTLTYYSCIDIYLMTSAFEGLPVALLEAMSSECVPVVTPVGGIRNLVQDQLNGYFIDANDMEKSATLVTQLSEQQGHRHQTARNARRTIEDHFSMIRMTKELEAIYAAAQVDGKMRSGV